MFSLRLTYNQTIDDHINNIEPGTSFKDLNRRQDLLLHEEREKTGLKKSINKTD